MKEIVYLSPLYFNERSCIGGGERFPLNCARGVVEAGCGEYSVEIISFDKKPAVHQVQPGVTLRLLSAAAFTERLNVLSWEIPAAIAGADLVHIHQVAMRASEMSLWVAKLQGKPVCLTDHGSAASGIGACADRLELGDRIICYSDYGASLFHTKTPIEVIKGGVDCGFFTPPSTRLTRDRVLYVGRLVPYKGVDQLIEALPKDLLLTICGRPYHKAYFQLLKKLARGKQVEFETDASDERILKLYQHSWANVLPSLYKDCYGELQPVPELMGLTLLEAMACGTPAICSQVAAMPEFIRHGETGFCYQNLEELTGQLEYLRSHPDAAEQMGQRAREAVEREYDHRVVGRKLMGVYERLLAGLERAAA